MSGPLAQVAQDFQLPGQFVQLPPATVLEAAHDVTRDGQHRRIAAMSRQHRRAGVENSGAGHDCENPRLATGARITKGHVGAGLFMTRSDGAHAVLVARQRIRKAINLRTGQREYGIDAMGLQAMHQGIPPRHVVRGVRVFLHVICLLANYGGLLGEFRDGCRSQACPGCGKNIQAVWFGGQASPGLRKRELRQ